MMTMHYDAGYRYGRTNPMRYYEDETLSPRTMDNYGYYSVREVFKISVARSAKVAGAIMLIQAFMGLVFLLIGDPERILAGTVLSMSLTVMYVLVVYFPYFFGRMKAYYIR